MTKDGRTNLDKQVPDAIMAIPETHKRIRQGLLIYPFDQSCIVSKKGRYPLVMQIDSLVIAPLTGLTKGSP